MLIIFSGYEFKELISIIYYACIINKYYSMKCNNFLKNFKLQVLK